MTQERRNLLLFEALELRAEYDARTKTLKDCLPEARQSRRAFDFTRDDGGTLRPAAGFSAAATRERLRSLETRRRKLNTAIQEANFRHRIRHGGDEMTLAEALEARKALNERIGELHTQVVKAAYERVIHKEDRDIVEENELTYQDSDAELDAARVEFRRLNRSIREASHEVTVDFRDE
jgi:hypothetical protein